MSELDSGSLKGMNLKQGKSWGSESWASESPKEWILGKWKFWRNEPWGKRDLGGVDFKQRNV